MLQPVVRAPQVQAALAPLRPVAVHYTMEVQDTLEVQALQYKVLEAG